MTADSGSHASSLFSREEIALAEAEVLKYESSTHIINDSRSLFERMKDMIAAHQVAKQRQEEEQAKRAKEPDQLQEKVGGVQEEVGKRDEGNY